MINGIVKYSSWFLLLFIGFSIMLYGVAKLPSDFNILNFGLILAGIVIMKIPDFIFEKKELGGKKKMDVSKWDIFESKVVSIFGIGVVIFLALMLFLALIVLPIMGAYDITKDTGLCQELIGESAYASPSGAFETYGADIEEGYVECCYKVIENHKKIDKCDVIKRRS